MSTSVKWISNDMRGAPVLSGTPGAQLAVTRALLLTGWGSTTAVSVSVSAGIATATLISGETFVKHGVVLISGGMPSEINGEARVLSSGLTSITWATTAADGVVTGTVVIKYAPQGSWEESFSGTNKAVFRSTHPDSRQRYLRIDDNDTANSCRIRFYTTMTDVDTGTNPVPTDAQVSGGGYLPKSYTSGSSVARYRMLADDMMIYFVNSTGSSSRVTATIRGFGDPAILSTSGDEWATVLSCAMTGSPYPVEGSFDGGYTSSLSLGALFTERAFTGIGGAKLMVARPYTGNPSGVQNVVSGSGTSQPFGTLPSAVDGKVRTSKVFIKEDGVSQAARMDVPGVYYLPHDTVLTAISDGDTLEGSGDLAGQTLLVVATGFALSSEPTGAFLISLGPWR